MGAVTLRIRPVETWPRSDETSLVRVLGSLGYQPCESDSAEPQIRCFQTEKLLVHDLWAESNIIIESLRPELHCLFKFDLKNESAKVLRWTQETGKPWFEPNDERF